MEEETNNLNLNLPNTSLLLNAAVAMHEIFITLMEAGFTEYQALIMVSEMIKPKT